MAIGLWINDGYNQFDSNAYTGRIKGVLELGTNASGHVVVGREHPAEIVFGIVVKYNAGGNATAYKNLSYPDNIYYDLSGSAGFLVYGVY